MFFLPFSLSAVFVAVVVSAFLNCLPHPIFGLFLLRHFQSKERQVKEHSVFLEISLLISLWTFCFTDQTTNLFEQNLLNLVLHLFTTPASTLWHTLFSLQLLLCQSCCRTSYRLLFISICPSPTMLYTFPPQFLACTPVKLFPKTIPSQLLAVLKLGICLSREVVVCVHASYFELSDNWSSEHTNWPLSFSSVTNLQRFSLWNSDKN